MRTIRFLILFVFVSVYAHAQTFYADTAPFSKKVIKTPDFNLSAGSSFTATGHNGASLATWISPSVSYPLTKRFSLQAGVTLLTENFYQVRPYYSASETAYSGNLTTALIFIDGRYQLNKRLIIGGGAYKEFPLYEEAPGTSPFIRRERQGYYLNAEYKVSDHFHIQAGFGYSKGNDPYHTDPFGTDPVHQNGIGYGFGY